MKNFNLKINVGKGVIGLATAIVQLSISGIQLYKAIKDIREDNKEEETIIEDATFTEIESEETVA